MGSVPRHRDNLQITPKVARVEPTHGKSNAVAGQLGGQRRPVALLLLMMLLMLLLMMMMLLLMMLMMLMLMLMLMMLMLMPMPMLLLLLLPLVQATLFLLRPEGLHPGSAVEVGPDIGHDVEGDPPPRSETQIIIRRSSALTITETGLFLTSPAGREAHASTVALQLFFRSSRRM